MRKTAARPGMAASIPQRGKLLTPEQACELLQCSRRWLARAVAEQRIPRTYLPGHRLLRFWERDLLAFLESNRVEAAKS
jgi:excisionase family DNA binding protein